MLFYWVILFLSNLGDFVLDFFFGLGIIGVVVKKLGCDFVGIEKDLNYIKFVICCLECIVFVGEDDIKVIVLKWDELWVLFGMVIELGLFKFGVEIKSVNKKYVVWVCVDGSVVCRDVIGFIYKIGVYV